MRRLGHIIAALAFSGAAVYLIDKYYLAIPYLVIVLGVLEAVFSSSLPDIIEPGGSSDHRGGAHSWRVLIAVLMVCGVGLWLMPSDILRYHAVLFLPLGYASHLLADAISPSGLPW